jgi:hypothetical protein
MYLTVDHEGITGMAVTQAGHPPYLIIRVLSRKIPQDLFLPPGDETGSTVTDKHLLSRMVIS